MNESRIGDLVAGGILFMLLFLGAVYIGFVRPQLQSSPTIVQPVLEEYMRAGQADDTLAAHRLFSSAGIRSISREALAVAFADRSLYDGFKEFKFTAFDIYPSGTLAEQEIAHVEAIVLYDDRPPARLSANFEQETETWRLRNIALSRPEGTP